MLRISYFGRRLSVAEMGRFFKVNFSRVVMDVRSGPLWIGKVRAVVSLIAAEDACGKNSEKYRAINEICMRAIGKDVKDRKCRSYIELAPGEEDYFRPCDLE